MLCFCVLFERINKYFKEVFPLLYEQVNSNMWIDILLNFTTGNLGTMFLTSIIVIFFELNSITINQTAIAAAVGGTIEFNNQMVICILEITVIFLRYSLCLV